MNTSLYARVRGVPSRSLGTVLRVRLGARIHGDGKASITTTSSRSTLAAGQPFPTMEVPWGYAYFRAAFYRLFGDHPWIPLLAQVLLNAAVPWLTYRVALEWTDRATAIDAAIITGLFSFNTIYASTQSSDSVCTVIFMAALVVFGAARQRERWQGLPRRVC